MIVCHEYKCGVRAYGVIGSDECDSFGLWGDKIGTTLEGRDKAVFRVCLKSDGFYTQHSQRHPDRMSVFKRPA